MRNKKAKQLRAAARSLSIGWPVREYEKSNILHKKEKKLYLNPIYPYFHYLTFTSTLVPTCFRSVYQDIKKHSKPGKMDFRVKRYLSSLNS